MRTFSDHHREELQVAWNDLHDTENPDRDALDFECSALFDWCNCFDENGLSCNPIKTTKEMRDFYSTFLRFHDKRVVAEKCEFEPFVAELEALMNENGIQPL